jgi:hypothetical protein
MLWVIIVGVRCKFVAIVLLLGLLSIPAAALSSCWAAANSSPDGCPLGCPMMGGTQNESASVQAQPAQSNCCEISSGKPAPVSQGMTPSSPTQVTPSAVRIGSAPVAAAVSPVRWESPTPPLASAGQSVLCTFLI